MIRAPARSCSQLCAVSACSNRLHTHPKTPRWSHPRAYCGPAHFACRQLREEALDPRAAEARRVAAETERAEKRASEEAAQAETAADASAREHAAAAEAEAQIKAEAVAAAVINAQVEEAFTAAATASELSAAAFCPAAPVAGAPAPTVFLTLDMAGARSGCELSAASLSKYDRLPRSTPTRPVTGTLFGAYDLISAPGRPLSYAKRGRPEIKLSLTTRAVRNDATKTAEFWLVSESNGPWQLCASTSKPGGSPDQVGLWVEFAGDTDPVVTPLRCILEAQAGREALLLTREMQLQRVFTALAAEEVKKASAKREAAHMTAATPPAEGAEAWAKQRAGAQAELKKASRRHAQLEDELSQIQQALTQSKIVPKPSPDPNPNPDPDH